MNQDITQKMNNGKIKVIREFGNSMYCVCYGENFSKGLYEGYKEFNTFSEAYQYFNTI